MAISIPTSVQSIGAESFIFNSLKSVILPTSLYYLGEVFIQNSIVFYAIFFFTVCYTLFVLQYAFFGNSNLNFVLFPTSLNEINSFAFTYCDLTQLFLPTSINFIGQVILFPSATVS